ncbi:hypothetical protein OAD26_00025 [bacterium]|nr:hypothetical protein [bacterium]
MFKYIQNKMGDMVHKRYFLWAVIVVLLVPTLLYAGWEQTIGNAMIELASYIIWFGGSILDTAVIELVLKMGDFLTQNGIEPAINESWSIIRSFCNLAFIFGFVWIGIQLILDADSSRAKKTIAALIVGALLINFSMLITKVIIDVSNNLSSEIYTTLSLKGSPSSTGSGATLEGISGGYMEAMGLVTLYKGTKNVGVGAGKAQITDSLTFYFVASILMIVAGFVFAAGGLLIVIRFVALLLIMIFSPVLFAATVFPGTKRFATMLWSKLFNYAFFAPIYLLFVLISFKIVQSVSVGAGPLGNTQMQMAIGNLGQDPMTVIVTYFIAILMLIISLLVAKNMSVAGGAQAVRIGQNMARGARGYSQRIAGGAVIGGTAALGRNTLGRRGNRLANDNVYRESASKSWHGRARLKMYDSLSKSSMDARRVGGAGKKLGIGEGKEGGYAKRIEDKQKKRDEMAKLIGQVDDDDIEVMARQSEVEQTEKTIRAKREEKNDKDTSVIRKQELAEEIAEHEKELIKQKNLVEQEKNRRILGSSFDPTKIQAEIKAQDDDIKDYRKKMLDDAKDYASATTQVERDAIRERVQAAKEGIRAAEAEKVKSRAKSGKSMGYAHAVGEEKPWFQTSNRQINKINADKLRKDHSKKMKDEKAT